MAATVGINGAGTFGPMLKEFYQGPVAEQINNRVWIREYFQKKSKGWSGKQMVIPIHVGRNSGVGFQGEAPGALPTAGRQQYRDLRLNSHSSYGRFQVSGLAMDTASKSGVGAFAGVMNEEMDRLVRDIANNENAINIYGGNTKGFLNQRRVNPEQTGGAQTNVPAEMSDPATWQYQGDFSYFDGTRTGVEVNAAVAATWIPIELVDMNTYELIPILVTATGAATANGNFFVVGFDNNRTNPTIDIVIGKNAAATPSVFTTLNVGNERAIAVRIKATQSVDSAGADFGQDPEVWGDGVPLSAATELGAQNLINNQPRGLFENLASQQHFSVDRFATGTTPATILQSTVITHGTGTGDRETDVSADLSLERLQYMMDTLQQDAGVDADVMVMNALMRHRYTVQLTGILGTGNSNNIVIDGNSGKVMDNQQNLAYGGVKFQYDRQFPICTIGMLHSSDWILAELTTGQFADEDGNVLFRVQGQDAYEGFWKHRYNILCKRPNAQLILTGIEPT
tara:strand:+ start:263 stop:1795 length:1533 start_codon:yes stop_codon:yes gene_type:complete